MESRQKFIELMGVAMELWPEAFKRDEPPSQILLDVYWQAFKPYSDEDIQKAFEIAMTTLKWFPKPVEILEILDGPVGSKASEAWRCLISAMEHVGAYRSVTFEDKTIHAVVNAWGGWDAICRITADELRFKAKEFKELYNSYKHKPIEIPKLIGRVEADNLLQGYPEHVGEPVHISFTPSGILLKGYDPDFDPKMLQEKMEDEEQISAEDWQALREI